MDIGIVRIPVRGPRGKDAYELALSAGFVGTLEEWIISLKGEQGLKGDQGPKGALGITGPSGKTSYQLAVDNGYLGSESDWYNSFSVESITNYIYSISNVFVSTWDTSLISTGSSDSNQIKLPLVPDGVYNFYIDWGDGNEDYINQWDQVETTHTYSYSKKYQISIRGEIKGWRFNNTGDKLKLLEISSWGNLQFTNTGSYFYGCNNLVITALDAPNLVSLTNFNNFFNGCTSLTNIPKLKYFNTSSAISMDGMFRDSNINNDISNLNYQNVISMSNFLTGNSQFSTQNYDLLLINLSEQTVQSNVTLDVPVNYTTGAEPARNILINGYDWTINDLGLI